MSVSKTVDDKIKALYARLATEAAKKAMSRVSWDDAAGAEVWMGHTAKWLKLAGAQATRWEFNLPKALP